MESESVIFGKWDNHGNKMNLRLSAQNSQKVNEEVQLVFKHGNKQVKKIEEIQDIRYIFKYTLMRSVEEFDMDKAVKAIELFNQYHDLDIDARRAIKDWGLEKKIQDNPK